VERLWAKQESADNEQRVRQVAIVDCPSCHKSINVPAHKLGRWIACPVCKMEFAALANEPEPVEDADSLSASHEDTPNPQKSLARFLIPAGLIVAVFALGGVVFALAKKSAGKNRAGQETVTTVSRDAMPPVQPGINQDGGLDLSALQGGGGIGSILGIGSTIQSFIYWTTILSVVFLVSSVGMLIWVARDSRSRGMESVASWITPILLTNIVAFLVYLMSRPQGKLTSCRHCQHRCLENAGVCPHCRRKKPVRKSRTNLAD
jgi:ribosomal protein L37AE/L43A